MNISTSGENIPPASFVAKCPIIQSGMDGAQDPRLAIVSLDNNALQETGSIPIKKYEFSRPSINGKKNTEVDTEVVTKWDVPDVNRFRLNQSERFLLPCADSVDPRILVKRQCQRCAGNLLCKAQALRENGTRGILLGRNEI